MENITPEVQEREISEHQKPAKTDPRKPYSPPRVIHELELEIRAGSTVPDFDPWDLDLP